MDGIKGLKGETVRLLDNTRTARLPESSSCIRKGNAKSLMVEKFLVVWYIPSYCPTLVTIINVVELRESLWPNKQS